MAVVVPSQVGPVAATNMVNRFDFPSCPPEHQVPTPPEADRLALDDAALGKLRDLDPGGRTGIVRRVLGAFDASLAKLTRQFEAARAAGDDAGLRHVAHTLRSSAASIGALDLSRCCQEIETQLRAGVAGRSPEMAPNLDAFVVESGRAAAAVRTILDQP
jgi:hypothetical protein